MTHLAAFADLAHTGTTIGANNTPLAIGYVAAYAKHHLGDLIEPVLFKYPQDLAACLETQAPRLAAFSNYMWNERLSFAFATAIKKVRPQIVTVFGGPNYPIDSAEQRAYLAAHPEIDFYVDGEGEIAFAALFETLANLDFDVAALKAARPALPNVHYMHGDDFVQNSLGARNLDLDAAFPSPYLMGMMDKFFDTVLNPLMQTSRGCPYSCTFCHDGLAYMNKTRRFSQERVRKEFEYVASRTKVAALTLADLNWGMFPEDIQTARDLARLREQKGWPQFVSSATAKNQKTRVVEMANILGSAMQLGASVQSTDQDVLDNIKRTNIGVDAIVNMAMRANSAESTTFTEIILCLPGDTKQKHFKSVVDMLDAGIQDIRSHQLVLLPGTEAATPASRKAHEYKTAYRVLPRSFGRYTILGGEYVVAEQNELCIGNATMPHEDYLECRRFNLTLGIFNNGNIFDEVLHFAEALGLKRSALLVRVHDIVSRSSGPLSAVYAAFEADENKNFWESPEKLADFVANGGIDGYLSGDYGSNQIYKFRTLALLERFDEICETIFEALKAEMAVHRIVDSALDDYMSQLAELLRASRGNLGRLDVDCEIEVRFDFVALRKISYRADPRSFALSTPRKLFVGYQNDQKAKLQGYFSQYGSHVDGLSYFIHRNSARELYRTFSFADATSFEYAELPHQLSA